MSTLNKIVLVLGTEARVVTAIARCLGQHGVAVDVASVSSDDKPVRTRAVRHHKILPNPDESPQRFAAELTDLIETEQYGMVVPASDTALRILSKMRSTLIGKTYIACPSPTVVNGVLDKALTLLAAERCGVPTPQSYTIRAHNLDELSRDIHFPLIAKPVVKSTENPFKTRRIGSLEELKHFFDGDPNFGRYNLLQEYLSGVGVGIETLIHDGKPVAVFQHRRLKEHPYTGGVSALAVAEKPDPHLVNLAMRLLTELCWEGVAMVEFRVNPQDGAVALMEVNGRYWGSLSLSIQAGIEFPLYEWQLAAGETVNAPNQYRAGVRMRWSAGILLRFQSIVKAPSVKRERSLSREALVLLRDLLPDSKDALFRFSDPWPALYEIGEFMGRLARDGLRRLAIMALPKIAVSQLKTARNLGKVAGRVYLGRRAQRIFHLRPKPRPAWNEVSSILFVCHGNIMRSAFAAALLSRENLEGDPISIDSAGIMARDGKIADPRAIKVATTFGIDLKSHHAKRVTKSLVAKSDLVLVMDDLNDARMRDRFPESAKKLYYLAEIGDTLFSKGEIADPYERNHVEVQNCFSIIEAYVQEMARKLRGE